MTTTRTRLLPGAAMLLLFAAFAVLAAGASWAWAASVQVQGAHSSTSVSSTVVISEFRTRGPGGASDEFVELYNLSASPVSVAGWKISGSSNSGSISTRLTITGGITIPPYGHFLAVNSVGYTGATQGDATYGSGIADDGGVGLYDASNVVVDQVGMSAGSAFGEGTRLAPLGGISDTSYERKPGGTMGNWQDTDNNASDFQQITPSNPQNLASAAVPPSTATPPVGTVSPSATGQLTTTATRTATNTATPTPSGSFYKVLFDNAHAETAGNADWVISTSQPDPLLENPNPQVETDWTGGLSAWGVALQRTGRYSLKTGTSAITYGSGTNPLDLTHFNALVLPEPNTLFTSAEKTAILGFVRDGGGLIMIADHDGSDRNNDGYDSLRIFNDLMNNNGVISDVFGITFDTLNIASENPSNDTPFADPLLLGPFGSATSTILRNGTTETLNQVHNAAARGVIYRAGYPNTGTTGVAVARSAYGNGRVVAMGDSSAIDDGTCLAGNTCFDGWDDPSGSDSVLFPNASEWVASGPPLTTATPTPSYTRTPGNTATYTFTPTYSPSATSTGTPTSTQTSTPTPATPTAVVELDMLYASAYATPQTDEAVRIINTGASTANVGGWQVSTSSGGITLPMTATVAPGQKLWIANQASTFRLYFGFNPDYEYGADTDPAVPNASAIAGFNFPDAGGYVQLRDGTGGVRDALVYGTGSTGVVGWSGLALQYYTNNSLSSVGQILYRKLDQSTGQPVADTDTRDDWAQDADPSGAPPTPGRENDDINGRKILRPGWALTDPANDDMFSPKTYTETGVTTKFLIAPDNIYDPVHSLIVSATTAISIETYEWKAPPLVTDIINAKNRGVRISIALDGDPTGGIDNDTLWAAQQWTNAGIPVYFYKGSVNTPSSQYRYANVHAKFMVVDNTWLATGSENFSLTSMPSDPKGNGTSGHRGTFVITNAPDVVAYANRLYSFDFAPGKYPDTVLYPNPGLPTPPAGYSPTPMPDYTSYMPVKPTPLVVTEDETFQVVQSPDNELRDADSLIGLVNTAGAGDEVMVRQQYERTYWQTNPTTGPNPRLQSYIAAAQRGATVRILLDAQFDDCSATNNSATVSYVSSFGLPNLQAKIGTPTADSIHDKMVLVRHGLVSTVHTSSINGSEQASKANREFGLQITSSAAYSYYKDVFDYDWAHSFVSNCFATPTATPTTVGSGTPTLTFTPGPTFTVTATPTAAAVAGHAVISEFRTRGPLGGNDEFVELYNPTDAPINMSGWKINASNSSGSTGTRLTISAGTTLPPHGHFLATNSATSGYSGAVPGDQTYVTGITDDGGIALLDSGNTIIDQVGMSDGSAYGEGTRLPAMMLTADRSYERLPGGSSGSTQDTGDNSMDFAVISPSAPQNLSSSPVPALNTPTSTSTATNTSTPTATYTATSSGTATRTSTSTVTNTSTPTPSCVPNRDYVVTQSAGATIVPGTTDIGNHCNDCTISVVMPFGFTVYDITFSTVTLSSNGVLVFGGNNSTPANTCLPSPGYSYALFPYWDDLITNDLSCAGCGIFTSVSGSSPSSIFNIEWRACRAQGSSCAGSVNFEARLYENTNRFEFVYGAMPDGGSTATVGVQNGTTMSFTEFECNTGGLASGLKLLFTVPPCVPPTPTISPTWTSTSTGTSTPTDTATWTSTPTITLTPTDTPVVSATPTGQALLVGHVTWQGRPAQPNALQQLPITLTLKAGNIEVNYPEQNTDASGFFTVTVTDLAPGIYNWRAKGPLFLAISGTVVLPGAGTTQKDMGQMKSGDCNNDNRVNITDFSILRSSFGKGLGDPGYDSRADFNGDNRINVTDFNTLKGNFGLGGTPPLRPEGGTTVNGEQRRRLVEIETRMAHAGRDPSLRLVHHELN